MKGTRRSFWFHRSRRKSFKDRFEAGAGVRLAEFSGSGENFNCCINMLEALIVRIWIAKAMVIPDKLTSPWLINPEEFFSQVMANPAMAGPASPQIFSCPDMIALAVCNWSG